MHSSPTTTLTPEQALEQSMQAAQATPAPQQQPAAQPATRRKMPGKTGRSRAREFAVQALYQHLVGRQDAAAIDQFTRELTGFHKGDSTHFDAVFHGCVAQAEELDALIAPHLDRDWCHISPIEHVCMWIGAYELKNCLDVPRRVVLNECIELAKKFGGTDGHRYVNGILHALASELRTLEVENDRTSPR